MGCFQGTGNVAEQDMDNRNSNNYLEYSTQFESQSVSINDFLLEKIIGKGSFGKVVLVKHINTEQWYAMKILNKQYIKENNLMASIKVERKIIGLLDHPFLVKLHYAFQNSKKLYLVMDFLRGGDLFFHLRKCVRFSEQTTRFVAAEILLGIEYLHQNNILYRDLKPENILFGEDGHVKIIDFGLSKIVKKSEQANSLCGTPGYCAPEIILKQPYSMLADIWSFGSIVYEMLWGAAPFYEKNTQKMLYNIINRQIPMKSIFSQNACDFLSQILEQNPNRRLGKNGFHEIKNHPFFNGINWKALSLKKVKSPMNSIDLTNSLYNFDEQFTSQPIKETFIEDDNLEVYSCFTLEKHLDVTGSTN